MNQRVEQLRGHAKNVLKFFDKNIYNREKKGNVESFYMEYNGLYIGLHLTINHKTRYMEIAVADEIVERLGFPWSKIKRIDETAFDKLFNLYLDIYR